MKIIIIHGGDTTASLKKLVLVKGEFSSFPLLQINGKELTAPQLRDHFASQDLFSSKQLIIVENPPENLYISEVDSQSENIVVFYFSKSLPARSKILSFPKTLLATVLSFPKRETVTVWPFLDFIFSKSPISFVELEKLLPEYGGQYILTMLSFGLRRLVLSSKSAGGFNEQKILNQKKIFTLEKIRYLYQQILGADFKIKSGLIEEKIAITRLLEKFLLV